MILLMGPRLKKICRASAWLLALAIVVLSLVPPSYRPITEASHNLEHLAIFLATGFAFGVAYPDKSFALVIELESLIESFMERLSQVFMRRVLSDRTNYLWRFQRPGWIWPWGLLDWLQRAR